ncbi:MAG TPA: ASKHA domain-containing protein, partial [Anaerolineales bacterium]|nr:ASKHA domain-containing protein [Anaerolineales bacterium]
NSPMTYHLDLQPIGKRIDVSEGTNLLDACQQAGVELVAVCGGAGVCGTCRVRLLKGKLSDYSLTELEELTDAERAAGIRQACQSEVLSDATIEIPPESLSASQRLSIEGREADFEWECSAVKIYEIEVEPPTLTDLRPDTTRVLDALSSPSLRAERSNLLPSTRDCFVAANAPRNDEMTFDSDAVKSLAPVLRDNKWRALLAVRNGQEIVAILPPQTRVFGLAVDIGTTKVAAYLVDLDSGDTIAKSGAMNPQIAYGEDIISRIRYINDHPEDGLKTLQARLIETLNNLLEQLEKDSQMKRGQIVEAVIVGNTAMHHIFAGLPVRQLGESPYMATVGEALNIKARDLGLKIADSGTVYLPPNIAGFVGADHVSMLVGAGLDDTKETIMALDIGTNTEISLYHQGHHWATSVPSGPAFEGAHIEDGMRAAPGAVERVRIEGDEVKIHTIENADAVGICGSGILDAVAEFVKAGLLQPRGAFTGTHPRLRGTGTKAEFVLVPASRSRTGRDVRVTRKDVNEIQLAKGAVRAGADVLLEKAGIQAADLQQVLIAGAFGTYLDVDSALTIGMLPRTERSRYQQIGNAAGTGARRMLVSLDQREIAESIARHVEFVELAKHPAFTKIYSQALTLQA